MNRNDLVNIMTQAIRDTPDQPPFEVAEQAAKATGLRRALYLSYRLEHRAAMVRRACWLARQEVSE
jgi:hypothetical protein